MSKNKNYKGFFPNTPIDKIIAEFDEEIAKNRLKDIEPVALGVFGLQIPTWPISWQGNKFTYIRDLEGNVTTKWSGLTFPIRLVIGENNIPIPEPILTETEVIKLKGDMSKYAFKNIDYKSNPNQFYVISVSDDLKDSIKPGQIIDLHSGGGGYQGFMHNGSFMSYVPKSMILSKNVLKGDSNE